MQQHLPNICIANPDQTEVYQSLVRDIYCKRLRWVNEREAEELFADNAAYNKVVLAVIAAGELVGGISLAESSTLGFPHECVMENLNLYLAYLGTCRKNLREVTRLVARPGTLYALMPHFIKALYWFGVSRKLTGYCMAIDMKVFLYCHKLGVSLSPIAKPSFCEGSWVVPSVLDLKKMENRLMVTNRKLWDYVKDKTNMEEILTV